jgi:hypothetical protein
MARGESFMWGSGEKARKGFSTMFKDSGAWVLVKANNH